MTFFRDSNALYENRIGVFEKGQDRDVNALDRDWILLTRSSILIRTRRHIKCPMTLLPSYLFFVSTFLCEATKKQFILTKLKANLKPTWRLPQSPQLSPPLPRSCPTSAKWKAAMIAVSRLLETAATALPSFVASTVSPRPMPARISPTVAKSLQAV